MEEVDRKRTWSEDAKLLLRKGAPSAAREVLRRSLEVFPGSLSLWLQAAGLERAHGGEEGKGKVKLEVGYVKNEVEGERERERKPRDEMA